MPVGEVVQMADQAAATVGVTPSRRHKALPMSHALRAQEPAIGFLVTAYGGIVLVASVLTHPVDPAPAPAARPVLRPGGPRGNEPVLSGRLDL